MIRAPSAVAAVVDVQRRRRIRRGCSVSAAVSAAQPTVAIERLAAPDIHESFFTFIRA
jgi:hypothetical protein